MNVESPGVESAITNSMFGSLRQFSFLSTSKRSTVLHGEIINECWEYWQQQIIHDTAYDKNN